MDDLQHIHKKFPGVVTCCCAACYRTFLRSGGQTNIDRVAGRTTNSRISPDLIARCVQADNYKALIPRNKMDVVCIQANLCDDCIAYSGLDRFMW